MQQLTLVEKPLITIMGIECRTSNHPNAAPRDIPLHWERFSREEIWSKIPNKASEEVFALYCDYEGDYTQPYSLVIGCSVNAHETIPSGMVIKTIPAGSYALFKAIGQHPKTLIETWQQIWKMDLNRTYTGDYELYKGPEEVHVLIAVHSK